MNKNAAITALIAAIGLRFGVSALLAVLWIVIRPSIAASLEQLGINPLFPVSYNLSGEAFLGIWNRYDGYRYFLLAYSDYLAPSNIANTVFYPLYPMLLRLLWKLTGADIILISLVLSTITAFFAFYMLFITVQDRFGEKSARWAVICLALYPTSLFLVGPYTESLFLALTLAAFYYARQEKWLLAGFVGALASFTRGPGVFTAFSLAWVAYLQWKSMGFTWSWKVAAMAMGTAAPGLAGIGFLLWRKWMGFPPMLEVQEQYFGSYAINPITGLINGLGSMITQPSVTTIIEGLSVTFWMVLFVLLLRGRKQFPTEWLIYFGLNLIVFLSKANSLISPMQSIARYVIILFPGFILVANWISEKSARSKRVYVLLSATVLIITCSFYAIGFFVG